MIEEPETTSIEQPNRRTIRVLAIIIPLIFIGGVVIAFLAGYEFLPGDPGLIIAGTIIASTVLLCCISTIYTEKIAHRMASYHELETEYKEAMIFYENEEWELAIKIFTKVMGEEMDHKRALYYTAKCYEQLDDWENVKKHCKRYLQLQPEDKEVWELLSTAHKRLFEFEEAEEANRQASYL
jgi:tetratricopeptide (TPR) repeat protein